MNNDDAQGTLWESIGSSCATAERGDERVLDAAVVAAIRAAICAADSCTSAAFESASACCGTML